MANKKVFVVVAKCDDDWEFHLLIGVYSTEENAEDVVRIYNGFPGHYGYAKIEAVTLDSLSIPI